MPLGIEWSLFIIDEDLLGLVYQIEIFICTQSYLFNIVLHLYVTQLIALSFIVSSCLVEQLVQCDIAFLAGHTPYAIGPVLQLLYLHIMV